MRIEKIYRLNIVFAVIYAGTVLLSSLLISIWGELNLNHLFLRTILCSFFSIIMLFISIENYKNGKQVFDELIKSKIVEAAIVFYYLYIVASCILYVYESVSIDKANGSYIMAGGAAIMLNVVNQSIKHIYNKEALR